MVARGVHREVGRLRRGRNQRYKQRGNGEQGTDRGSARHDLRDPNLIPPPHQDPKGEEGHLLRSASVGFMPECRITLRSGDTVDVQGDLQAVTEELHRVATRREHTFAVLQEPSGRNIAMPPDSVL